MTAGRLWIHDPAKALGTYEAAVTLECIGIAATEGVEPACRALDARKLDDHVAERLREMVGEVGASPNRTGIGHAVRAAGESATGTTSSVLGFIAACWEGHYDPGTAVRRLSEIVSSLPEGSSARLRLCLLAELGFFRGETGQHAEALSALEEAVVQAEGLLGHEDLDTVNSQLALGVTYNRAGRYEDAVDVLLSIRLKEVSKSREAALLYLARDRVLLGLQRSRRTVNGGEDVHELLVAIARHGDADAFARLPAEIRRILET